MKNSYDISADGTMVTIWLKRKNGEKLACLIDAEDLPKLKALDVSWFAHWNARARRFYAECNVRVGRKRRSLAMHSYIMDTPQGLEVDHIHHHTLDNRRSHLEVKTHMANMMNRRGATPRSKSGHRGISPCFGKFHLRVTINGKVKSIGTFSTLDEALTARDKFPAYARKTLGHSEASI